MSKKIWLVAAMVVALSAVSVGATDISRGTVTATVTQADEGRYMCYAVCPPAVETGARAIDPFSGDYFEAAWTIVHNTNTEGSVTLYDLSAGAVVDSLVGVRLIAGMTYGGNELVADSIVVWIWDVDDTCYIFGKGTYVHERTWGGD